MRTNGEIFRQSSGKLSIFPVLAYFSTCSSLKSDTPTPIKILFSKIYKDKSISHKVWRLYIKGGSLWKNLKMGVFLLQFSILSKKNLVIEQLSWLSLISDVTNATCFETLRDSPNNSPSLKFLVQRIDDLRQRCVEQKTQIRKD